MTPPPPTGSTITTGIDGTDQMVAVPYSSPGVARYGYCLFLTCWLVGWAYGWLQTSQQIMSGKGNLFVFGWIGAWTVGGAAAAYTLYRMLRPTAPEVFRFMPQGLRYDSGAPPFVMPMTTTNRPNWSSYFPKRIRVDVDRKQLGSLRLRQISTGNRLTVDVGAMRLELARDATEIEREWLYGVLAQRYSLTPLGQTSLSGEDATHS